ncbi:sugar kinase [Aliikangiella coralliicola]|uniref:Sugar kinase n=2 Tax=Aliikangiella coralliicola TaxID=2592383 RepID=A0A545UF43_9GAMM|nr:sugar kinase [Aliikangiella coralliicola]
MRTKEIKRNSLEPKVIIVHRETRLDELKRRYNTVEQARFYVEHLGADFNDYVADDKQYKSALGNVRQTYQKIAKVQLVDRSFLSNFIFAGDETVVVVGQDGLVANTLKYVKDIPLVGVNPEPERYDGVLLPFNADEIGKLAPETIKGKRQQKAVTLAKAELSNGQSIVGVNDIFIGPKQHSSARYELNWKNSTELQSSSGIVISTGLGSTGWFQSLLAGARQIAGAVNHDRKGLQKGFPWNSNHLYFCVREPFPSQITGTDLVFGKVTQNQPLRISSHMPENGVIFSDGILDDTIDFHSGLTATVGMADWKGRLVV